MLKVTVAEVKRTVIKQLGINLSGSLGYGTSVLNFNTANPFPINGTPSNGSIGAHFPSVSATLQAMEQAGVIHTLAEPTLTAISGESATFIAGGKFPYPDTAEHPGRRGRISLADIRREPGVHARGAVGRPHQPEGDDGSLRARP